MEFTGKRIYFRGLLVLLFLLPFIILVGCGGGGGGGGVDDNTQDNQDASVVGPEGGEVLLSSGGSIVIPEGAFTENTNINVTSTLSPVLPDGVEAVGKALSISVATQPSLPVTLRVPIPESVSDPENLVIIRVESDSTTTFLMTEVVGDEIVAASPGFSKFITGYFTEAGLRKGLMPISGQDWLLSGEHSEYNISSKARGIGKTTWKVSGSATLLYYGDTYAIIKAGEIKGIATLGCEYIDVEYGIKWFGTKQVEIDETSGLGLYCSIITRGNTFYPNEEIQMTSEVYGPADMPVSLSWDFGDGEEGNTSTDEKRYDLPSKSYASVKSYKVTLKVIDSRDKVDPPWDGRRAECYRNITVIEEPLSVKIDGPSSITGWSHPGSLVEYTATASGGEAPYLYAWLLNPSNDSRIVPGVNTSKENFFFDQPGQFLLEVTANDIPGDSTKTVIPIVVKGGESLSTRFVDLPATANPNESVRADISIRGGVLVASGKKAGYTLEVNWGDDSGTITEENVGKINTPYDGTLIYQNHTYAENGTYTVTVNVYDAAGNHDWAAQDIEITAPDYFDYDGDGYYGIDSGGDDCDDDDASINPGATEVPNDGIDQDCDGEDTIVEIRQWYVFKLSGVGYHKTFSSEAAKVTGYEYQALWLLPSEVDGIVGTDIDNTTACENGPWAGPVLAPAIWESRSMVKHAGPLISYDDLESYRCPVPNWVYNNPICDQWQFEYDEAFYNNINSLCGN